MNAFTALAAALAVLPAAVLAQPASRFEAPAEALAGDRIPIRIAFRDPAGAPFLERVAFQLAVSGQAFFLETAREGRVLRGGGTSYLIAESTTGAFEIDLEAPAAEDLDFFFMEDTGHGVGSPLRTVFAEAGEEPRPRRHARSLGGPAAKWSLVEAPPDPAGEPPRGKAWWSGPREPSRESALLSMPFTVPRAGGTFLICEHRYGFEDPTCIEDAKAHHGARIEIEAASGSWNLLAPAVPYPHAVDSRCDTAIDGQRAFGGSSAGRYERASFDLRTARGKRTRARFHEAAGCEECGDWEGWFVDLVRVETTYLALGVLERGADEDGDGLANEVELERGSDPRAGDTDGDGLADGAEDLSGVFAGPDRTGTDPLSPDTDGGGVPDGIEVALGSDPNAAAGEPARISFPRRFPAGGERGWSVRGDGSAGGASDDPRVEVFAGEGGFRLIAGSDPFPAGEAFDLEGAASALHLGPERLGPFAVTRRVSAAAGVIRYFDTLENAAAERVERIIVLLCEFAQRRWVEVEGTSSGDREWSAADSHVHWNDRDPLDGMPVVLWLHGGTTGRAAPDGMRLQGGVSRFAISIALDPGERASLLHFAVQSGSVEESRAAAAALEEAIAAGKDVTLEEEIEVVNWAIDGDGDGMPGWYEARAGLDPRDPEDAALDPDGDGLTNREEYGARTDPRSADTDGDTLPDGKEVEELKTDPLAADSDADGIADGLDPFPARRLDAVFGPDVFAIAGETAALDVEVRAGGEPHRFPVRFTLTAEGATFQGPVEGGEAVRGLGTPEVLLEVREGQARIAVAAGAPGRAIVRFSDSESQGILNRGEVFEDFEAANGGFTEEGASPAWEWGAPAGTPPGAASGARVWGTGLRGGYAPDANGLLTTPEYHLSALGSPALEFRSFVAVEEDVDDCVILVRSDAETAFLARVSNARAYEPLSFDLRPFAGRKVRFVFAFASDFSIQDLGWFIDDFRLQGLRNEFQATFVAAAGDEDRDGLDNRTEVRRGTNPRSPDTDRDGLSDAVETATGVFAGAKDTGSDPTKPDSDSGGERDGDEVERGSDPNDGEDDEVPIAFPDPFFTIEIRDGGGRPWSVNGLGTAIWSSDLAGMQLGVLEEGGGVFLSDSGRLSRRGQELILAGAADFQGTPITRRLFVSPESRLLRWLDIFANPGGQPVTRAVLLQSGMGSIVPPEVVHTSSGDQVLDPGDETFIVRLGEGTSSLYVGHAIATAGADLKPGALAFSGGISAAAFALPVPARGKAALLHFAALSSSFYEVQGLLALARGGNPDLFADLSVEDLSLVANFRIDADGDGLTDGYETRNGLDPRDPADAAADPDGDGLTNLAENALGTDPQKSDTDGDGLDDAEEGARGTDPLNLDTDGDRVSDALDPVPLHAIAGRVEPLVFALAGVPAPWMLRLELADGRPLPAEVLAADLTIAVRFDPPLEVTRVRTGAEAGVEPDGARLWKPERDRLVLELLSPASGLFAAAIEDRLQRGIRSPSGALRFLAADGDEDADGLPNRFEVERGYDPLAADSDADGIADRFETGSGAVVPALDAGTFPWEADSDGGGEPDGIEIERGLDPFAAGDDLRTASLPFRLGGAGSPWEALPSWALTGRMLGAPPLDNGAALRVNGLPVPYQSDVLVSQSGGTLRFGPAAVGDLRVSRLVRAAAGEPFVRFTDVFTNEGAAAVQARVEITFDLSADAAAAIAATSSGDSRVTVVDRWVILGSAQFRLLHVFFGGSLAGIGLAENDLLRELFVFEVPPGDTRTLVHFLAAGGPPAVSDLAPRLAALAGNALEGLAAAHLEAASNLPPANPLVWGRFPRGEVAAGGTIAFAGEFLGHGIEARGGGRPLASVHVTPGRLLVEAPASPGRVSLEVTAAAGEVLYAEEVEVAAPAGFFRRGDADASGEVDLADAIGILDYLFRSAAEPRCLDAADADDTGKIDLSDGILLLQALFQGTGGIPFPGGAVPGPDPSGDALGCGG